MTLEHWHFYFAIWKHSYLCLRRILQKVFATSLIICGKKKSLQEDNQWLLIDNWIINYCYELDNQWLLIVNWKRIMNYSQLDNQWLLIANWAQQQNGHFRELLVNPGNFVTQALRRFCKKIGAMVIGLEQTESLCEICYAKSAIAPFMLCPQSGATKLLIFSNHLLKRQC